jgi:hypothetical protein
MKHDSQRDFSQLPKVSSGTPVPKYKDPIRKTEVEKSHVSRPESYGFIGWFCVGMLTATVLIFL